MATYHQPPNLYLRKVEKRKNLMELIILLVIFGILIGWLSLRSLQERGAMIEWDRMMDVKD